MELEAGPFPQGLPRGFLHSLRTLFDILDDGRRGSVHILEIESRWQGGSGQALPPGVLQCLRRVAPASGYLTFDRFVSGLRSSLLSPGRSRSPGHRGEAAAHNKGVWKRNKTDPGRSSGQQPCSRVSEQTQPVMEHLYPMSDVYRGHGDRAKSPLRVKSMNIPDTQTEPDHSSQRLGQCKTTDVDSEVRVERREANIEPRLQVIEPLALEKQRHVKTDGRLMARYQSETTCGGIVSSWRQGRDRSELRRHTITSGVDYNRQLKCMKELELEKDALLQGLEMVDCARGWYIQQIQAIQDRQKNISKSPSGNGEVVEGNSVRLEQLLSKLQEVRCCLADLTSCSAKRLVRWSTKVNGSECHSHCSVPGVGNNLQMILMLKEQNRQLTKEVSDKSDRITQLEQEKSALIKQLFTARSHNHQESSQLDSTFI
ncbi:suppressor APC domain-containing protein 2 isoform X1 [Carcharodon carcharias]|uniref:suppressor APC domain-containing protein 2 isoform X1 n=1 Tax=Carcharodon carcharias TaxID=13397 RepID=UPI001B7D91E7|nr:suppressor APC domain-containing protein 2 isoform X1 [Carcharodon carcharias]